MLNTLRHLIKGLVVIVFRCSIVRTDTERRDSLWMSHFQLATFSCSLFSAEMLDSDWQRPLSFFSSGSDYSYWRNL